MMNAVTETKADHKSIFAAIAASGGHDTCNGDPEPEPTPEPVVGC